MLFGSKTILHSSVEILDSILQSGELKGREGSVVVELKEGRKTVDKATIYFHDELVYAVHVDSQEVPIANRVITGEKVSANDVHDIVRNCGNNPNSPDIVRQLLVNQLISEFDIDTYVKEHFLDQLALVLSWNACVGKWYVGDKTKDFTMPSVSFPQVKKVVASREIKKHDFIKEVSRFFRPEELGELAFVKTIDNEDKFAPEVKAILALCNGEATFEVISNTTGIGKAVVMQTINLLWKNGSVSLKYGTIEVSYESALIANNPKEQNENASEETQEETIPLSEKSELEESKVIVEDEPELIDESLVSKDITEEPPVSEDVFEGDTGNDFNEEASDIHEIIVPSNEVSQDAEFKIEFDDSFDTAVTPSGEKAKSHGEEAPIELSEEEIKEAEKNLNEWMANISVRYGIPNVNMENVNVEDIIDIDPLYVETPEREDASEETAILSEELNGNDDSVPEENEKDVNESDNEAYAVITSISKELKAEVKVEESDLITVENADDLSEQVKVYAENNGHEFHQWVNEDESKNANTEVVNEDNAEVPLENEVEESIDEIAEEDTESATEGSEVLTTDNQIKTLPQLMAYLSKLQADENVLDGEFEECTKTDLTLSEKIKEREAEYEKAYEESMRIHEKCEEMRQAYEELAVKLEASYKELENLDSEILESKVQLDENTSKSAAILEKKAAIINEVEKTTRSFTIR